jgi:hypothetical protein
MFYFGEVEGHEFIEGRQGTKEARCLGPLIGRRTRDVPRLVFALAGVHFAIRMKLLS